MTIPKPSAFPPVAHQDTLDISSHSSREFEEYLQCSLLALNSPSQKRKSPNVWDDDQKRSLKMPDSKQRMTIEERLDKVFDYLKSLDWTLADFLHHTFSHKDHETHQRSPHSQCHGNIVEKFLSGHDKHTIASVVEACLTSPYGSKHISNPLMFSVTTLYINIKPVWPALTSFAAQIVEHQLVHEAKNSAHKASGLHASVKGKEDAGRVKWTDLGMALIPNVGSVFENNQPLTLHYMRRIATPRDRKVGDVVAVRQYCPPELVSQFKSMSSYVYD